MKFYHIKIFSYNWTQKKDKSPNVVSTNIHNTQEVLQIILKDEKT